MKLRTASISLVSLLAGLCHGWAPQQQQQKLITIIRLSNSMENLPVICRHSTKCFAAANSEEEKIGKDDEFMSSLRSRMTQINDRATKLPIVVIDTMLPRQVLRIESDDPVFMKLIQTTLSLTMDGSTFGMVGIQRSTTGQTMFMKHGVEVQVMGQPERTDQDRVRVQLRAGRRFRLAGELATSEQGWTEARVAFMDSKQEEEEEEAGSNPIHLAMAIQKGREMKRGIDNKSSLIDRWIKLARQNERQTGQIDRLLLDLGEVPHSTNPNDLAFWVGALINPLPGMGVALEIRPALLMAKTSNDRMEVALHGIKTSIEHMDGTKPLW